jgi:hypothetical protein
MSGRRGGCAATPTGAPSTWRMRPPGTRRRGSPATRCWSRVTSAEDRQWLYVAGSRGVGKTTFYSVVTSEPAVRSDPERQALDVPAADRTPKDQDDQMAAVARRDGSKRLAADTTARLDLRSMSKHDLRARRDRLAELLAAAPGDQSRRLDQATSRREQHDQRLVEATSRLEQARDQLAGLENGPGPWWLRRGDLARAREQAKLAEKAERVARQQADRAADRERAAATPSSSTRPTARPTPTWRPNTRQSCAKTSGAARRGPRGRAAPTRMVTRPRRAATQHQGWSRLGPGRRADDRVPATLEREGC